MAALLRARSSNLALLSSSVSHLARRQSPLAAPALRRHFSSTSKYEHSRPFNFGIHYVPQQKAYIIERFGKYRKILDPGLNFLIPLVDKVAYVQSLKNELFVISDQMAITHDNVQVSFNGVLHVRVEDPYRASYKVSNPMNTMRTLAMTTVRTELGKMELDMANKERERLNQRIVSVINEVASGWGVKCLRYEIKDINPTQKVLASMELQLEAERKKRAFILQSEGQRDSEIKIAEGNKESEILAAEAKKQSAILAAEANQQSTLLVAEANKQAVILEAEGEAKAILQKFHATAEGLERLSEAMKKHGVTEAANLNIAQEYMKAFGCIAKEGTTLLLPTAADNPSSMIAQALSIFKALNGNMSHPNDIKTKITQLSANGTETNGLPATKRA